MVVISFYYAVGERYNEDNGRINISTEDKRAWRSEFSFMHHRHSVFSFQNTFVDGRVIFQLFPLLFIHLSGEHNQGGVEVEAMNVAFNSTFKNVPDVAQEVTSVTHNISYQV